MAKKTKNLAIVSADIYDKVEQIIEISDKFQHAIFWRPAPTASQRRANERKYSMDEFSWRENGDVFTASYDYRESCHHVYATSYFYRNGNRTNLTAVKNSFGRLIRGE